MSFSLLGLLVIFVLGVFIIFVSMILEPLASLIQRHFKLDAHPGLEWRTMQKLQLQRLAYEELGYGQWTVGIGGIPITRPGEKMAVLDVSELKKGRFVDPHRHLEAQDGGHLVEQESNDSYEESHAGNKKQEFNATSVVASDVTHMVNIEEEKMGRSSPLANGRTEE